MIGTDPRGQAGLVSAQPIRIVLADDQPLFRRGAVGALREDPQLEVVAETDNGDAALEAILDLAPDVAVVDAALAQLQRTRLLAEIAHGQARTKVLIVTPPNDPGALQAALTSGVGGYLTRNTDKAEICAAVTIVAGGGTVLSEQLRTSLAQAVARSADSQINPLSGQEQAVLCRVARGHSARGIGADMHLSEATVKAHLRRSYEKLGVATQAAAVAEAMRRDLIDYRSDAALHAGIPREVDAGIARLSG